MIEIYGSRGELDVATSDGDVHIDAFTGPIKARTSDGDIVAALGEPAYSCHLQTSDGNIDVQVDAASTRTFECTVSDGDITSELPIQGRTGTNSLRGDINGGGAVLSARTADGDITLKAR